MKSILTVLSVFAAVFVLAVIAVILLTPGMDSWGATDEELAAVLPGDELVPDPAGFYNHAISIAAAPEKVYPWLAQIGAGRGGWYSYTSIEGMMNCPIVNADRIHEELQNIAVGDVIKICPEEFGPPPYIVAQVNPNQALVLGHKDEAGNWAEVWQFILLPQADGSTRFLVRTRTTVTGGIWAVLHPGIFIMERGMMLGIKQRAEAMD